MRRKPLILFLSLSDKADCILLFCEAFIEKTGKMVAQDVALVPGHYFLLGAAGTLGESFSYLFNGRALF